MDDKTSVDNALKAGLQHVPAGASLVLSGNRSGIIARGRRDAAQAASNPHYRQAVSDYMLQPGPRRIVD